MNRGVDFIKSKMDIIKSKTKVKINYIYYIIMINLVVLLYRKTDELLMCFFMTGVIGGLTSVVHMYVTKNKLVFEIIENESSIISKNDRITIKVRIHNSINILSPYIYIFMNQTDNLSPVSCAGRCVMIKGNGYKDIDIQYKAHYSGQGKISVAQVVVQDFFGIIKINLNKHFEEVKVLVRPEVVDVKRVGSLLVGRSENMDFRDGKVVRKGVQDLGYDLEPYKEGDSIKLIHQKILARRDICMVRERQDLRYDQRKYVIILDSTCVKLANREKIIDKTLTATLALTIEILKQGQGVSVVYNLNKEWKHQRLCTNKHISDLINILATYSGDYEGESKFLKEYLINNNLDKLYKIFITPALRSEYIDELEGEKNLGVFVMKKNNLCEDTSLYTWYLSDEYEVNRYV